MSTCLFVMRDNLICYCCKVDQKVQGEPMKFQQLRYLVAVSENGLNITAAARQLHTSQPGVSRQLKLLEEELGFQLFEREGRALTRTTAAGEEII